MGLSISKNLFECVKDKEVKILSKNFATAMGSSHKGKVVGFCFGSGTDMFIELDNGLFVNTKYIESIEIIK